MTIACSNPFSECVIESLAIPVVQSLLSSAAEKKARGRFGRLEDELERSNQEFIDNQRQQQQVCVCVCARAC